MLCRSSGADTDIEDSFEEASHAGDQSFSGGLSTTDFEGVSMEASQTSHTSEQQYLHHFARPAERIWGAWKYFLQLLVAMHPLKVS